MEKPTLYYKDEKGRYRVYEEPEPAFDNRLFRRVVRGKKVEYKPCSMLMTNDLEEGVWVVVKHEGSKSFTSGKYMNERYMLLKASDIQEVSLSKLGGMERLANHLSRHWQDIPKGLSIYDTCCAIVGLLFKYEKEKEA